MICLFIVVLFIIRLECSRFHWRSEHAAPMEKENLTQFNKVEQQLKDSGILRSRCFFS
jgi:hypothetical protein